MRIRKILVPLVGDDSDRTVAETALGLGKLFGAVVEALHVKPRPEDAIAFVGEGMSAAVINQIVDAAAREMEERATKARHAFDNTCRRLGVPVVESADKGGGALWTEVQGSADIVVPERGRLADLVVTGHPAATGLERSFAVIEAALFSTGHPLLLAGAEPLGDEVDTVAIAWNGSGEAAGAVYAALPFLKRARKVVVLTIGEAGEERPTAKELVDYLALHEIEAETARVTDRTGSLGDQLIEEASERGAKLLVMGGYGHSRLRELVLGGVTRSILSNARLPILMAH